MARAFLAAAFVVIASVVGALVYRELNAGLPVVLAAPSSLAVTAGGTPLGPGGWTNSSSVGLRLAQGGTNAGMDVEIQQESHAFTGSPTITTDSGPIAASCRSCIAGGDAETRVTLADGSYHVQARLHDEHGVSPWVVDPQMIRIDTRAPQVSGLASPTDPNQGTTYHSSTLRFTWQGTDAGSGVDGYSYRLDSTPTSDAREELRTRDASVMLQGLNTGTWYFHVRALDRAGNWGKTVTFPVRIDVTPPGLAHVHFSAFQFDPQFQPLTISFAVTRAAREIRVGVYGQSNGALVRLYTLPSVTTGQTTSVSWDGKDAHGIAAAAGMYEVYIRAIDSYGHSSVTGWRDFLVEYKRIVVSLSKQSLTAYDGNSVFLTSLVTTGNPKLPTPQGTFFIEAKFHPFTFHSPWPKSSPFWYPPSLTQWAMLFREGGYFIHDAPWRSVFGPGSNQQIGTPGQNYTGTHGCINVPTDVAQKLFAWAQVGTTVQVVP